MLMESGSTVFEDVPCALCGAEETEIVYPGRGNGDRRAREDFHRTYRASGDDVLADPLVRCRRCDLQYVSPRPSAALLLESYARGDDPAYVSQLAARERTFG